MDDEQRVDTWLWHTRIYKTRSKAAEACRKGRITTEDGRELKPAGMIKVGDLVNVQKPPITYTYEVIGLTKSRVGAKLVPQFLKDRTPQSEYEILEMQKAAGGYRQKGLGRPTKKERRQIEKFKREQEEAWDEYEFDSFWD